MIEIELADFSAKPQSPNGHLGIVEEDDIKIEI
jgi:hypothetical protein